LPPPPGTVGSELADIRASHAIAATDAAMRAVCGESPVPWADLDARLRHGTERLREWWECARGERRIKEPRWLQYAERATAAIGWMHEAVMIPPRETRFVVAGKGGPTCGLQTALGWTLELLKPEGRSIEHPVAYLDHVRRYPNPQARGTRFHDESPLSQSLLDVGDVLESLARLTSHAELSVLLRAAVDVMGYVVRDPAMLRWVLDALPRRETLYRQGAVVALGALGGDVTPADAMNDARDHAGLNSYLLAVAVSPARTEVRVARARGAISEVAPELRQWLRDVTERFADGDCVSAIM
jgi:hypothetical protein